MAMSFRRDRSWSSRKAASRIEAKLSSVASDLVSLRAEQVRIAAELGELQAFQVLLSGMLEVERSKIERRHARQASLDGVDVEGQVGSAESTLSPEPGAETVIGEVHIRSVASIDDRLGYDSERKLFLGAFSAPTSSTEPRRIELAFERRGDPDFDRLLSMIEIPGLLHTMVMAERAQMVVVPADIVVPEEARGLPLAEAYIVHEFSTEALNLLKDPQKAPAYLEMVVGVSPTRGGDE